MKVLFGNANIEVDSDLMAASKSILGNGTGLACILGTGSNSCLVSKGKIFHQVDSLGFLLGDEGSGAYLGRKFLVSYARRSLPSEIIDLFYDDYKIKPDEVVNHFYDVKLQNRFAAGFSVFLKKYISEPAIKSIVRNSFTDFFENIISQYPNYKIYRFNCIGSIAFVFKDILEEVANNFGMVIGHIHKSPIDGLCKYHIDSMNIYK